MKIIVVRHGETEDNRRGILRGSPEQGLTLVGIEQARRVGMRLKGEHIDKIYSSDQIRCIETTEAIKIYYPDITPIATSSLGEISRGKISKLPLRLPSWAVEPALNLILNLNIRTPGGESWQDLRARVKDLLNELYGLYPDQTVLLVTHGVTIRAISDLLKSPAQTKSRAEVLPNAEVLRFTMDDYIDRE